MSAIEAYLVRKAEFDASLARMLAAPNAVALRSRQAGRSWEDAGWLAEAIPRLRGLARELRPLARRTTTPPARNLW